MAEVAGRFDYVVVGGGHNGLVAACYLQKAGFSTAVFEATDRLGGAAHTGAVLPAAPQHLVSLGAQDDYTFMRSGIPEDLALSEVGYHDVDHSQLAWLDRDGDASLLVQQDLDKTIENVRYFSTRDALRLSEMAALADPILNALQYFQFDPPKSRTPIGSFLKILPLVDRKTRKFLYSLLMEGAEDYVLDQFESEALRSIILASGSINGEINSRGSAIAVMSVFAVAKWGSRRPVGGMQAIPDALAKRLVALGGIARTRSVVEEITFEGARASGVRLASGEVYGATRAVMMAAMPNLLADLVQRRRLSDGLHTKLTDLPTNAHGAGPFKVDMALSGKLEIGRHQKWRNDLDGVDLRGPSISCVNHGGLRALLKMAKRGQLPATLSFWSTIFTAKDPTLAPAGQDVLYLYTHVPLEIAGGWEANKAQVAERLIDAAALLYPNIRDIVIDRVISSPQDIEARWNMRNGQYMHVDNDLLRQGGLRPAAGLGGYRLPIPGVYLAGSGAAPGGGVTGLPGRGAALKALADARKASAQARPVAAK